MNKRSSFLRATASALLVGAIAASPASAAVITFDCYVFLSPRAEALAHPAKGEALRRSGA